MRNYTGIAGGKKYGFLAGFALALVFAFLGAGHAQTLPSATPDLLNQLQQQFGIQGLLNGQNLLTGTTGIQNLPPPVTLQPPSPTLSPPLAESRLEQIMSARAGARLRQFGYEQLGKAAQVTIPQTGAVQDEYILGPGDEIIVSLRGQENGEFRTTVDRNGQVVLPRLSPIPATGRRFGDFRQDLEAAVHRAYVATNASVSVGRVRQISVLVSGEVNNPGQRLVTGLSSVVDALLLSGGVKKTGSLRNIRIQRAGRELGVDLYAILTSQGSAAAFGLADGDRILVPPLGNTVAVTGLVRQPGIFELMPHQSSISLRNLLALAGGEEIRGRYRLSVLRTDNDGQTALTPLDGQEGNIGDSEILFVELGADRVSGQATLSGGVGLAGSYAVQPGMKLSEMLKAPGALGETPYTLFGVISRRDPRTLLRTLVPFTPVAVLNGTEDEQLQMGDIVHPLTRKEARLVRSTARLYLQRRGQADQILRDPLSEVTANQTVQLPQSGEPNSTNSPSPPNLNSVASTSRSATQEAQTEQADIQLIGSLTQRQLDMIANSQVSLMEFRYLPERTTNANDYDGVYLPSQAPLPNGQPNMAARPTAPQSTPSQNLYGQGLPVLPESQTGMDQNDQPRLQRNLGETNTVPPAPNFEEQPSTPGVFPTNREAPTFNALAQQLGIEPLVLMNFLIDHQVTLDGAVRGPGSYLVGPNTSLQDLVQAAGGTVNWADDSGVELISTAVDNRSGRSITQRTQLPFQQGLFASYIVKPHDEFRFNRVYSDSEFGNVTIQGEVRFTGTYPITRGEHLSDLLVRAGGLTNVAYPYGTVYLRKSAAETEHQGYLRAANEIEDQLVVAMTRIGNDKIDATTFGSLQTFVSDLRNQKAIGRISVTADPSVLASKPELDPLLESGDVIYVPQRPSTIAVLGQVSQPGNFPYRPGLNLADYIQQAGGYSTSADESMTFIVLPDGSARKVQSSWLSFDNENLSPGSTIVVPRDVTPLDTRQIILDASSIFSQLAVSAASLAVLATSVK